MTQRQTALAGGFTLLAIAILAPLGYVAIIDRLVSPEDAALTAENIAASGSLFRLGVVLLLVNAILDLVAAWALYIYLKPVSPGVSLLSAWFRVAYTVVLVIALSGLVSAHGLLTVRSYRRDGQLSERFFLQFAAIRRRCDAPSCRINTPKATLF